MLQGLVEMPELPPARLRAMARLVLLAGGKQPSESPEQEATSRGAGAARPPYRRGTSEEVLPGRREGLWRCCRCRA